MIERIFMGGGVGVMIRVEGVVAYGYGVLTLQAIEDA